MSLFTNSYMSNSDLTSRSRASPFIAFSENADTCAKEIDSRCDKIELLSSEILIKLNILFGEIQKGICFTQTLNSQLQSSQISEKSDNSGTHEKLKLYLMHVYECEQIFKSFNDFTIVNF